MATWTRRVFDATGITQVPPGPALRLVQARSGGGTVMLMLDVSGSMSGRPIVEAVRGAEQFVAEAIEAGYRVGVMLWHTEVVALSEPDVEPRGALEVLARAGAGGGNNLLPPLQTCHHVLGKFVGDRVVALFGDGDLTPKPQVLLQVATMKGDNIRFVTRGLGVFAAQEFGEISDEEVERSRVDTVDDLADGIAGMAASLRVRP